MANTPVNNFERGRGAPPSNEIPGGNRANNGFLPLTRLSSPALPLNRGDRKNGSASLAGMPSPVHLPDQRFDVRRAKMPQPPSAIEPGKGAIPISPWDDQGRPMRALTEPDADKPPRQ